jgi:hypothetical protein
MKLLLPFLMLAASASATELTIQVTDETGRPVWTRLEVRGPDGRMFQSPGAILDQTARNRPGGGPFYLGSFIVEGKARLDVPPGRYTVIAEHGLEYERGEKSVEVAASPAQVEVQLKPWVRMCQQGWYSGDMHLHRPLEDSVPVALAEDVNLNVAFTMWNKKNLWEGKALPADPVIHASNRHLITVMNAEDERGGGAWMLHQIAKPLALAVDGRWFPAGIGFVREARAQKRGSAVLPWFDSEKPFWWEVPVMMALATPDSLGVLHNHLNQYGIHANEAWGRPRDEKQFPGWAGFVDYSIGLYYRYLNLGFRLPPSAGSASGVLPGPAGYNRMYVPVQGPLTVEKWYAALKQGKCFVTNGPILFFDVKKAGSQVKATVDARAREPIDRIEIVANGEVIKRFDADGARNLKADFAFSPRNYTWVAARCFLKSDPVIRLAHSSPVYLDGKRDARADARYFVEWMDELIAQTRTDTARFKTEPERAQILKLYEEARSVYERKAR